MVLSPISSFSHKAPYSLAVSMLLFGELVFYFFLSLSVPPYAATVFDSFILLMTTTGVASTFHHHTQQKRPLRAVSFVQKCDSSENDGWQACQRGQGSEAQTLVCWNNSKNLIQLKWGERGTARSWRQRGGCRALQTLGMTLKRVPGVMGRHWRALRKGMIVFLKVHSGYCVTSRVSRAQVEEEIVVMRLLHQPGTGWGWHNQALAVGGWEWKHLGYILKVETLYLTLLMD